MCIKKIGKKILFYLSSGITDLLYRRPYFDKEKRKRLRSDDRILHLDLAITECCSLKCRDCSNLMQYYTDPKNLSTDSVINDLKIILDSFHVGELKILGGEPFVNQKCLIRVLEFLSGDNGNNVDQINIITNGTIMPSEECMNAIKNNLKAGIVFSNYGSLSNKQDELIELCQKKAIRYCINDPSYYWLDFGVPKKYNESDAYVRRQYLNCYNRMNCMTLYRGKLYICPRQAHGIRLGLLPDNKDEYVDLYSSDHEDKDSLRMAIVNLIRRKEQISSCYYCINAKYIHLQRGIQKE